MKKFLLFALAAMIGMPMMAQDEIGADVTKYVANAGFDEDFTWQADGSTKQPIVKEYAHHRSVVLTAEDGSVYARGTGKRADGYEPAWNGFIGQLKGWEMVTNKPLHEPYTGDGMEWTYFGCVPYDLGEHAVPIADDGTTFLAVPEKVPSQPGDDNKGFIYLRAGWGGQAIYKQTVSLPCAKYLLEYWTININPDGTRGENLSRVTCRRDEWKDETGFTSTEWTKHEIEFTPTTDFTLEFGFKSEGGSGGNPFLCIDGIKLTKIADADEIEILLEDCFFYLQQLRDLEAEFADYPGLAAEIDKVYYDLDDRTYTEDVEVARALLQEIKDTIAKYEKAKEDVTALDELIAQCEELAYETDYPGKAAFEAAIEKAMKVLNEGGSAEIEDGLQELKDAMNAYYESQVGSMENPANFSHRIANPWFVAKSGEPKWGDYGYEFPNEFNEETPYTVGSAPFDGTSEGWYVNGTETGGDQRLNWQQGRTCWNAWASGFTGTLGIAQDLTGLPAGFYKVEADMITQAGYCTDQHTYAKGILGTVNSAALTHDTWVDGGIGEWETLTTTDAVIVPDGKLTIGALGTGTGEASAGWYLVTNFKLLYCGPATEEQIAEAIAAREADVKNQISNMHFAADKAKAEELMAAYEASKNLDELSKVLEVVEASEGKYAEIMQEGKTIPTVEAGLADGTYGEAAPIAKYALDYMMAYVNGAEATYEGVDSVLNIAKVYVNDYIPVFQEAAEMKANTASEKVKQVLGDRMAAHVNLLCSEMKDKETVDAYIAELKELIYNCNKQDKYDTDPDATDYTDFIQNPMAQAEAGWTFECTDGPIKSGQWYTGDTSVRYFDSWNATAGELKFYGEQVVLGLPNGTYTIGADVRTSGEGAFIFGANGGAAKADTTWVEIPVQTYTHVSDETGEEVTDNATDKWGQIWEEANERFATMTDADPDYFDVRNIVNANGGQGYGWMHLDIPAIEVKDHKLVIGMAVGEQYTGKAFTGTWFSVDNWTLTLTQKGDNSGWDGPLATGINEIATDKVAVDGIYTINGVRTNKLQRGLNIVVRNGKAMKIMVK